MQKRRISMPVMITVIVLCFGFAFSVLSAWKVSVGKGSILDGSWASSFEESFDENLKHYRFSLSFWNRLNDALFGEGKDGVLIGDDGWLLTTEEFDYPKGFEQNIKNNLDYILTVKDRLSDLGAELIVVPLPAKARVLEGKLGKYTLPEYRRGVYQELQKFLSTEDVILIDLLTNIKKPEEFFLKTDTHWSLDGAELTAKSVVEVVPRNILEAHKQQYILSRGDKKTIEGDLTRYTVRQDEAVDIIEVSGGTSDDLFSDPYIPVTLIGTSYSANKMWGFENWLKYYLQADVLNMADEGLGPFDVMDNYLASDELKNMKPKLVVWEMPERYLLVKR